MRRISRRAFLAACAAQARVHAGRPEAASLLDLGPGCLLPESLAGFRSVIAGSEIRRGAGLVVPGAGRLSVRMTRIVRQHLRGGGPVLLESAVGLTRQRIASPYFPYVDFTWPVRAQIREFYPLPLCPQPGDAVIATYVQRPVGLRRGGLILLGSPVGSALLAGDEDAHRWMTSVLQWMRGMPDGDAGLAPPTRSIRRCS